MKSVRSQTVNTPGLSAFNPSVRTHNPACASAFNTSVCVTATNNGLWFHWWGKGFTDLAGQGNCGIACGGEGYEIEGGWGSSFVESKGVAWNNSTSHSVFVPLKKPDDYQVFACLGPTTGIGICFKFRLVVPQVGNSNLAITTLTTSTTTLLPTAKIGERYLFRLTAHGGTPPYRWIPVLNLPPGLTLIKTGPKAGTITGILRKIGGMFIPVIVRDRAGHSAYEFLALNQVS
jgi:hypothetical protein